MRPPWVTAPLAGLAVLLAGAPVQQIVQGHGWVAAAGSAVGAVVATGLLLHRQPAPVIAVGQGLAVLVLLTARFTEDGLLGVLPGPAALRRLGELTVGAGQQISVGVAPVPATPELLVLISAAFGLLAVAVHLAVVGARAPAAAGVPLLAAFAIPTALADELLPVPTVIAAAAGYGLLLLCRPGSRSRTAGRALRRVPVGAALLVIALLGSLTAAAGAGFVGTAGRFAGGRAAGAASAIGLTPFTSLRGQLADGAPTELLRVRGLPRATYLRALTLSNFVSNAGWRAARPAPGVPLPGPAALPPSTPGEVVDLQIENEAFGDYWLPLYGEPLAVEGLPAGQWWYDARSGTGYALRPRFDYGWRQRALLPQPTAVELRRVTDASGSAPGYDSVAGVDPRVRALTEQIVAGRENNFDRAMALQDYFTGRDSSFRYSLATAPGNGDDALVEFLTVGRTGYCEQFASAMAVMLREAGIPSRVAVGFTAGTDAGEYRSIRTSDAHAWVEAYFPGTGWVLFDPTPLPDGRAITPPYVQEARGQSAPDGTGGLTAAPGPGRLEPADAAPAQDPAQPPPVGPDAAPSSAISGVLAWLGAGLVAVGLAALVPAYYRRRQRERRLTAAAAGGPDAAGAAWRELLAESTDRGVPAVESDTVRGAARRLVREHRLDPGSQQALRTVITAVESSWYGTRHPGPDELVEPVQAVVTGLSAGSPLTLRDRLLPRSVRTHDRRWPELVRAAAVRGSTGAAATPARNAGGSAPPSDR